MNLYALALELTLLLCLSVGVSVFQMHHSTSGRRTFALATLAGMVWVIGELLVAREFVGEALGDRIKYAGVLALPPLWFGFSAHAAGLPIARRVPWFTTLLLLPGVCLYLLLYSGRYGSLFLRTIAGGEDLHGPLWLVSTVYGQALVIAGSLLLMSTAFGPQRPGQLARRLALGVAPLAPLVGNALYLAADPPWRVDPTPILLCVTLIPLRGAVFAGGLLQPLTVSQYDLVKQLPLGVLLTDRRGSVVEMNDAAANRLGASERTSLGRRLDDLVAEAPPIQLRATPLMRWGRAIGGIVLVGPPEAVMPPTGEH